MQTFSSESLLIVREHDYVSKTSKPKMFLWARRMKFCPKVVVHSRKSHYYVNFVINYSSKCSSGQMEGSFENPAEN